MIKFVCRKFNVMLPALKLNKEEEYKVEQRALQKLEILGMANLASKKSNQLSGGEK